VREENRAPHAHTTAREFKPDLILMDVIMPGMDGGELASRFKADPALTDIPIIFLTATISKREAAEGVTNGGYLFLPKPVGLKNLVECIENALSAKAHEHKAESKKDTEPAK
jgi:CheY-like chemotaxis protein